MAVHCGGGTHPGELWQQKELEGPETAMTHRVLPGTTGCRRQVGEEKAQREAGEVFPARTEAEGERKEISHLPSCRLSPWERKPAGTHFASAWRAEFHGTDPVTTRLSPQ